MDTLAIPPTNAIQHAFLIVPLEPQYHASKTHARPHPPLVVQLMPSVCPAIVEAAIESTTTPQQEELFAKKVVPLPNVEHSLFLQTTSAQMEALQDLPESARDRPMDNVDGPSVLALAILELPLRTAPNFALSDMNWLQQTELLTQPPILPRPTVHARFASAKFNHQFALNLVPWLCVH